MTPPPAPARPRPADPRAAQGANDEGLAAMQAGDFQAARAAFARATAADPAAMPLWHNLAHACRRAGDFAAERAALEAGLAIDRVDFGCQLRMAQWQQQHGDPSAALQAWSGVGHLAAGLPGLGGAARAEVEAGMAWSRRMEAAIERAVDAQMAEARVAQADHAVARRIGAFVDHALGRRAIYANQCAGLHYPFLPADEFFDSRHFPWFAELEAGAEDVRAELAALLAEPGDALRPYVRMEPGTPANKWSPLDGSLAWSACFLHEYGVPNAPVLARCPRTAALLARLPLAGVPGRAPNAFFSILQPRSAIPPHTGVSNTRAIVHLALDVPPHCGFRVGGETREWVAGKAFAFDDTIEHEAWNRSDLPRSVLILDTWNPHLGAAEREAIVAYSRALDAALANFSG